MIHIDNDLEATYSSCPVVCVLAHNEETNIAETLRSILQGNRDIKFKIKVYANGCTDNTHQIVNDISANNPSVELIKIKPASKPNAWNIAFKENIDKVLIFADGDIKTEPGTVSKILNIFEDCKKIELACCQLWPDNKDLCWQQRFTGFTLIPLKQDFLKGGFYGIRRSAFVLHFQQHGLLGLPDGIVGDDAFLDNLVNRDRFICINSKVTFKPPVFSDYYKFRARMKWQDEQMQLFLDSAAIDHDTLTQHPLLQKIKRKIAGSKNLSRFILGGAAAVTRVIFMNLVKSKIENEYKKLGPVTTDGSWILSEATRSHSTK